jgi:diguanylate cyclase (GGDEF)-like protein
VSKNKLATDALLACVEIGQRLTATLEPVQVLQLIMTKVSELIEAENWSLLLVDELTGALRFEVVVGLDIESVRHISLLPGQGIAGHVLQTGETLLIDDVKTDSRFYKAIDQITGFQTKSIVCIPLFIRTQVFGVLEVINVHDMDMFQKSYLPILKILADYAAIAIDNARHFTKIQQISRTDEYTGLPNARYMHEILPELLISCEKNNQPLAVVFIDIDNFKLVVDAYGHLQGSQILNEIGQTIITGLTEDDILIKYGGDEFILFLPNQNKFEARKTVTAVQDLIRDTEYLQNEQLPIRLTASIGIAVYPEDAKTPKDLLIKADNHMYHVKMSTKNGIATAD